MNIRRFDTNPIIVPDMDDRMGDNINGASLIKVPDWIPNPLGKYYLYFAHHQGTYIRLAYADQLEGPWKIHRPGVLDLSISFASAHIASPDVHVLEDTQEIRMYYHGCCLPTPPYQVTRLAVSSDGLTFKAFPEILGSSYWRAFEWGGYVYTLEMPGLFRRSRDGVTGFEEGPTLFTKHMRHSAVLRRGDLLHVFYSNAFDCPEYLLRTTIQLTPDWRDWNTTPPELLLGAEKEWEGADCPVEASRRGSVHGPVHQLRDPCIYEEGDRIYLLYSVAGEHGIAISELTL